jgi:anti-anti-sigma factor
MSIRIECQDDGEVLIMTVSCFPASEDFEVDLLSSADIESRLQKEFDRGCRKFLIDLKHVTYMHSRAFWAIVRTGESVLPDGGRVILVNLSPYLQQLMDLTSAAEVVESRQSLADGRIAFQSMELSRS